MYPISYSLIFGFHPKWQLDRTVIFRSFNHSLEQLNGASCLDEMLQNFDPITAIQLKDCTESAFKKRKKNSISEIFSCELKFNCDILKKWFSKKFTWRFLELDTFSKNWWVKQNPIEWGETKCFICNFELEVGPSEGFDSEKMTYTDLIVKREHAYLRNIHAKEKRNECEAIKNIENYYFHFQKFIQISPLLNEFYSTEMMTNFLTSTISIASSKIRQYLRKTMKAWKEFTKN